MEENLKTLLDSVHPNESSKYVNLESLILTWKYLPAPSPNPLKVRLFYRNLKHRNQASKASLCMVHGFAEHSGKLLNIACYFALQHFEVHLIDLRSFGYSGGARCGHDLIEFQSDIKVLLDQARSDLPCFLYGHSMGGLLVTTILINNPQLSLSGAILSAPLYETSSAEMDVVKEQVLDSLSGLLKDNVLNSYIAPGCLSSDDKFMKKVFEDRKLMPFFGPGLGLSMMTHMKWVLKNADKLAHPALFCHGDQDILTYASTTKQVYEKARSKDKTFRLITGAGHEPHHDVMRDSYIPTLLLWAQDRAKALPFGKVYNFKAGLAGLPQKSRWPRLVLLLFVILYFIVALRVKIRLNPVKCLNLLRTLSKYIWPLKFLIG
jgi:alpha-beta hydrolase superfamily lysophospholipase